MSQRTLASIHEVHDAATGLTLACAKLVGPVAISLGIAEAPVLGEQIPAKMRRALRRIDRRNK
jgi:hypothetical protein